MLGPEEFSSQVPFLTIELVFLKKHSDLRTMEPGFTQNLPFIAEATFLEDCLRILSTLGNLELIL